MYPEILFFTSIYCSPCKGVERLINKINLSMFGNKLIIQKIDISKAENLEISKKYNVFSVPTLIIGSKRLSVNIDEEDLVDAILQAFLSSVEIPIDGDKKERYKQE
ncbi:MAG: thioredoxin family protein [Candidatus Helarchaeota archaeon]